MICESCGNPVFRTSAVPIMLVIHVIWLGVLDKGTVCYISFEMSHLQQVVGVKKLNKPSPILSDQIVKVFG